MLLCSKHEPYPMMSLVMLELEQIERNQNITFQEIMNQIKKSARIPYIWIQRYNTALEEMVWEMNDPHILYFDAYRVLSDENGNMRKEYAESNGVHLSEKGCSAVLDALYRLLDAADAMPLLEKYDSMQPLIKQIETDEDVEDDEEAEEGDRDPEEDD